MDIAHAVSLEPGARPHTSTPCLQSLWPNDPSRSRTKSGTKLKGAARWGWELRLSVSQRGLKEIGSTYNRFPGLSNLNQSVRQQFKNAVEL